MSFITELLLEQTHKYNNNYPVNKILIIQPDQTGCSLIVADLVSALPLIPSASSAMFAAHTSG